MIGDDMSELPLDFFVSFYKSKTAEPYHAHGFSLREGQKAIIPTKIEGQDYTVATFSNKRGELYFCPNRQLPIHRAFYIDNFWIRNEENRIDINKKAHWIEIAGTFIKIEAVLVAMQSQDPFASIVCNIYPMIQDTPLPPLNQFHNNFDTKPLEGIFFLEILSDTPPIYTYRGTCVDAEGSQQRCSIEVIQNPTNSERTSLNNLFKKFARKARILSQLQHPQITKVIGTRYIEQLDGDIFMLILEWVNGDSLASYLVKNAPLPIEEAKRLLYEISKPVVALHKNKIVLRSLDPNSIILKPSSDNSRCLPVLTRFPLIKDLSNEEKLTFKNISTSAKNLEESLQEEFSKGYTAQEVIEGKEVDTNADIYSLAAIFYHMISGRPIYDGLQYKQSRMIIYQKPSCGWLYDYPGHNSVLRKALSPIPSARYQSVYEFLIKLWGLPSSVSRMWKWLRSLGEKDKIALLKIAEQKNIGSSWEDKGEALEIPTTIKKIHTNIKQMLRNFPKEFLNLEISCEYNLFLAGGGDLYCSPNLFKMPAYQEKKLFPFILVDIAGHDEKTALYIKAIFDKLLGFYKNLTEAESTTLSEGCKGIFSFLEEQMMQEADLISTGNEASPLPPFVAAITGIFDLVKQKIWVCAAGDTRGYYFSRRKEVIELTKLWNPVSPALWWNKESAIKIQKSSPDRFAGKMLDLCADDFFIFFTDGLCELQNKEEEEFGLERIETLIESTKAVDAEGLLKEIVSSYQEFIKGDMPTDDITIIVVHVK